MHLYPQKQSSQSSIPIYIPNREYFMYRNMKSWFHLDSTVLEVVIGSQIVNWEISSFAVDALQRIAKNICREIPNFSIIACRQKVVFLNFISWKKYFCAMQFLCSNVLRVRIYCCQYQIISIVLVIANCDCQSKTQYGCQVWDPKWMGLPMHLCTQMIINVVWNFLESKICHCIN